MLFKDFIYKFRMFGLEYFKKYYASYRGIVDNVDDEEGLGRIQVKIPQIYGDKVYKYWAWSKGQYAGKNKGQFFIPEKGDGVWISFENGDARYPIWEHGWWAKDQVPETATPLNKVIQTESGNLIEFDDENKLIRITDAGGSVIELNTEGLSLIPKIDKKISLGSLDGSAEPSVLGDTLQSKIESYMDLVDDTLSSIQTLTVPTAMGTSGVPINASDFIQIQTDLAALKSEMSEILSKVVTLD